MFVRKSSVLQVSAQSFCRIITSIPAPHIMALTLLNNTENYLSTLPFCCGVLGVVYSNLMPDTPWFASSSDRMRFSPELSLHIKLMGFFQKR